jgi:hypothetical protein
MNYEVCLFTYGINLIGSWIRICSTACAEVEDFSIVLLSVADPNPHGSAFILVGWIRIRIGNTDPDPGGLLRDEGVSLMEA